MKIESLYQAYLAFPNVQTDSRKLKSGDIFFALKGPHFNGNQFARKALDAGAQYAVIDELAYEVPGRTFLVDDVLTTLQQLAHFHRTQLNIPVIAITGSNGKTTTKELIHAVLSQKYKVYTTEGNLNNHIGIPLTLLRIKQDAQIAVIEMGANHLHEIEGYCRIADPTHGLITNCGKAHLEGFGSLEGVRKAKGELFDYLKTKKDATAFVLLDEIYLQSMSEGIAHIITYGTQDATVIGHAGSNTTLLEVQISIGDTADQITTQLVGDYNLPNVLAAVTVGHTFEVPLGAIKSAISGYTPSNSRSQLVTAGSNKIILDAYNANPTSMQLAIENFKLIDASKKVLMLGAMAEMGTETASEHAILIQQIKRHNWHQVLLVGRAFEPYKGDFIYFNDAATAATWLQNQYFEDTYFLIKGSRSSQMEQLQAAIKKQHV